MSTELGGKKRSVLTTASPGEDKLYYQISQMQEPYKSYACFLYLFGSRVSEALGIKTREITGYKEYVYWKKNGPRTIRIPSYRVIPWRERKMRKLSDWESEPLRVYDLELKGDVLFVRNIPVFKVPSRPLSVKYALVTEERFYNILKDYINTKQPDEIIWKFSRKTMWKKLYEATGIYPHKLRSLRATKDVIDYGLDVVDLQRKFGWTQITMPLRYVQMRNQDIIYKMKKSQGLQTQTDEVRSEEQEWDDL